MARVANQLLIKIGHNRKIANKDNPYAVFNLEILQKAMRNLDGGSFKLWLYIQKNQNDFEFALSQKACEEFGLKKDSYRRAKDELITKGYLRDQGNDVYEFVEEPECDEKMSYVDF